MGDQSSLAVSKLYAKGIDLPNKPKTEIPRLPRDITELGDDDLMELFVVFTSWSDYLSAQMAVAVIDEREASRSVDVAEAQAMVKNWKGGSGDRVAIVKAQIACDPEVMVLHDTHDEKYAYRKMVEVLSQNVDRDSAVVSRELTRRTAGDNYKSRSKRFQ